MSEREDKKAQREAVKSAASATPSDTLRAHEDALARYLRMEARRQSRRRDEHHPRGE